MFLLNNNPFLDESPASNNAPIFNKMDIVNLSNFCLPWGAAIESWSVDQKPPETVFFTFVITNASYTKVNILFKRVFFSNFIHCSSYLVWLNFPLIVFSCAFGCQQFVNYT